MLVFHDEFLVLSKKIPEIPHIDCGLVKFLKTPCVFLKNNRCSIYNDRPLNCKCYPFYGIIKSGFLHIGIHPLCPPYTDQFLRKPKDFDEYLARGSITKTELGIMIAYAVERDARTIISQEFSSKQRNDKIDRVKRQEQLNVGDKKVFFFRNMQEEKYWEMVELMKKSLLGDQNFIAMLPKKKSKAL